MIRDRRLHVGSGLMTLGALAFVGYAVVFLVLNFTGSFLELGIGREQVGVSKAEIQAFEPDLYHYISHLHLAVSGFVGATGVAVVFFCWFGVRRGLVWAWLGAVSAPVLGLAVALPAHYAWGLDTVAHLGLVYVATAIFVAGAALALTGLTEAESG
jgi:hypothetical protein